MKIDPAYGMIIDAAPGDLVRDDLTGENAKIVRVDDAPEGRAYWLDNEYLGGGRHPWEISQPLAVVLDNTPKP